MMKQKQEEDSKKNDQLSLENQNLQSENKYLQMQIAQRNQKNAHLEKILDSIKSQGLVPYESQAMATIEVKEEINMF